VQSPVRKKLKSVIVHTVPRHTGFPIEVHLEIMDGKDFSKIWDSDVNKIPNAGDKEIVLDIDDGIELCGDIFFKLTNDRNKKLICRFAMNTSFVNNETNIYEFGKKNVDPV